MKKITFTLLLLTILFIPAATVQAEEYTLKSGKEIKADYAGDAEDTYNYFKLVPSKNGFAEIKVKTSNKAALTFDICNADREVVAENITVNNKKKVLHKVKKGQTYYIRTKGVKGQQHTLSYKMNTFGTLTYAKKYSYTFTNASFYDQAGAIYLKFKAKDNGNMVFMCNANNNVDVQYLSSKKKVLSNISLLKGYSLTGIGVQKNKTYYIKLWKTEASKEGTTTLSNMKCQVEKVALLKNGTKGKAKKIQASGKKKRTAEGLLLAGKSTTAWYRMDLKKKKKLSITFESHLLQNNGDGVELYICNRKGKVLHTEPILITDEASSFYKKKYKMKYPKTNITTGVLPIGTYYLKVVSNNKTTSGSYKISWK